MTMDSYRKITTELVVSDYPEFLPPTHGPVVLEEQPAAASDLKPYDAEFVPGEHGVVTVDLSHIASWVWVLAHNLEDSDHDVKVGVYDGTNTAYQTLQPGEHCKVKHKASQVLYLDEAETGHSIRVRILAVDADVTDLTP
jgi:hypothetical protein